MDPITALRQAIYYLDRELAPGNKVKAFRRAIGHGINAREAQQSTDNRAAGGHDHTLRMLVLLAGSIHRDPSLARPAVRANVSRD